MTIMRAESEHQGGLLSISLGPVKADRHFGESHPEATPDARYWCVTVMDNGVGMSTKTVAKIFDPFFTTKEKGKGTGLGLAMTYFIVQQHNGFVDVYSEVGVGSTFNVYFPILEGGAWTEDNERPMEIRLGEGLILVVDDEEIMRRTAADILEECGYQVLVAESGDAGIQLYRQRGSEIKAVLLDIIMPRKTGRETFLELREVDPGIRVLMTSGFGQDNTIESIQKLGVDGFIRKPYTLDKLSEAMHRVIQGETWFE
jgi:two-component system, cell cycle sensor histidine kinase and response regulator CckA